ncbi:glycoside hydrolase 43 family protein [Luteolibacter arcticus]|uniref:Glycoside hydrolase 43 family protein n=1 Tax=Luteolibacter arcticus TaxID=1581411 RepID=A0ABT3GN74_9BACT|nr:glycoside hydrolase 43 family protein [Luteolibacter arcticus]MCW1924968.1 glycoside hydrolase 43 family protein [Luteolibacter arcticus]
MNPAAHSYPWVPDQGDGTYRNPVLHADYSDPDVVRVGSDYFLTSSSFNCTPGLPILHSRDLVNWRIVNHALKNLSHPRYSEVQPGHGVWAPSIRHHDGKFWIFFPTPDEGLYLTTATDPAGDWSAPHLVLAGKGLIDPCPFWDDDGKAYLIHAYAGSRAGIRNKLHLRPMAPDGSRTLGKGKVVIEIDPSLPALEGPKLHKRSGWYYISAPAGGVATGWQCIFRSRSIQGPYEEKTVLAQRGSAINGPHQGALVDTPDGDWWFIHFQDKDLYGRIVHLQPVRWEDDWPLIGEAQDEAGVGRPVLHHRKLLPGGDFPAVPQDSDEFESETLGFQWQWHGNHEADWHSFSERGGHLRLRPHFALNGNIAKAPNLLLQKFPASEFEVETRIEIPHDHASLHSGLVVAGENMAALDAQHIDGKYRLSLMISGESLGALELAAPSLILKLKVGGGGVCRLGLAMSETPFYQIGPSFPATPGRWIGAKVGIYCVTTDVLDPSGYADFA